MVCLMHELLEKLRRYVSEVSYQTWKVTDIRHHKLTLNGRALTLGTKEDLPPETILRFLWAGLYQDINLFSDILDGCEERVEISEGIVTTTIQVKDICVSISVPCGDNVRIYIWQELLNEILKDDTSRPQ